MFNHPCSTKINFWSHWKIVIWIWRGTWRTGSAWRLAITAACILCPLNAGTSCVWMLSAWIRHLNFTNITLLRCKWVPGTLWEICARCTIVLILPTLHGICMLQMELKWQINKQVTVNSPKKQLTPTSSPHVDAQSPHISAFSPHIDANSPKHLCQLAPTN